MFTAKRFLVAACWIAFLTLNEGASAELRQGEALQPTDPVESVEFTIHVGDGADLAELVALDLGLGFPFWLYPIGQDDTVKFPIGAIPQESPGGTSIKAGDSATFVFRRDGEPGVDQLRTSPQLLDGIVVSDIARVGILSRGSESWKLNGYELRINKKLFAANDAVHRGAKESIEELQLSWVDLTNQLEPLRRERDDLRALRDAGLAEEHEISRLAELESQTEPLDAQIAHCAAVLRGVHPWFVEQGLFVPGRTAGAPISQMAVTVVTAPHTNAETFNRVYFRTGGRKYFLRPTNDSLTPELGPQRFNIELASGPITASDMRGISLGMLAHGQPYAQTPDRWHPQRLVVEVDGRVTYDSQLETVDNLSLETIRLIPPAHFDDMGQISNNSQTALEVFVWHSGQAQGLDLNNGGPIPYVDGAAAPSEPISDIQPFDDSDNQRAVGGEEIPGQGGQCWPGERPLPGESWPTPLSEDDPAQSGVSDWGGSDSAGWGNVGDAGWDDGAEPDWTNGIETWEPDDQFPIVEGDSAGGGVPIPSGESDPSAWLLSLIGDFIEQLLQSLGQELNIPPAVGEPSQINNVQLLRDDANPARLQVIWDVSNNDDSHVTGFEVALWRLDPETGESFPIESQTIDSPEVYASNWFDVSGLEDPTAYIKPWVTAVLDASDPSDTTIAAGAALPWLPLDAAGPNQPQLSSYTVTRENVATSAPVVGIGEARIEEAAWKQRVATTMSDSNLATFGVLTNGIVGPPDADRGDVILHYVIDEPLDPARRYQLIGYVGFVTPSDLQEPANVETTCTLFREGQRYSADLNDKVKMPPTVLQVSRDTAPQLLVQEIDFSLAPEGATRLAIDIKVKAGAVDAFAPLAIYGLRLTAVE